MDKSLKSERNKKRKSWKNQAGGKGEMEKRKDFLHLDKYCEKCFTWVSSFKICKAMGIDYPCLMYKTLGPQREVKCSRSQLVYGRAKART